MQCHFLSVFSCKMLKYVAYFVLCAVIACVDAERNHDGRLQQYTRIKRGKYYSNPPQRFYSRPPASSSIRGPFSYTPPPNFKDDDSGPPFPGISGFPGNSEPSYPGSSGPSFSGNSGPPYPGNSRPPKVSKPHIDGLGTEDLNNIIKYLSKSDLDKLIQMSGRDRDTERYNKGSFDNYDYSSNRNEIKPTYSSNNEQFKDVIDAADTIDYFQKLVKEMEQEKKFQHIEIPEKFSPIDNYVTPPPTRNVYSSQNSYPNNLETEETMHRHHYVNAGDIDNMPTVEEHLPKPLNLRNSDEFEISYTHDVPTVVKAESSYEVKNFGELPLMNYNSKLDTLSSYHVPHYTVSK